MRICPQVHTWTLGDNLKRSAYKFIALYTAVTISAGSMSTGIVAYADTVSSTNSATAIVEASETAAGETATTTTASAGNASEESAETSSASSSASSTETAKSDSSSSGTTSSSNSSSSEVLIEIGDGPVDDAELGITSDADIAAMTDGSMIPEYNITSINETTSNVVTNDYTVAEDSGISESTTETSAANGKDELIEIVDNVDDFNIFKSAINKVTQSVTNIVSTITGKSQSGSGSSDSSDTIAVNEAPSRETTSVVTAAEAASDSSSAKSGTGTAVPAIATTRSRQEIINYAKQFLGNPYVYGGTSLTDGADCSGFVQQIFKHFGVTTGRSSRDQIEKAQSITFEELQPGDVIFYSSGDYVNHVAIYAGDGVIIHAANARTGICTGKYNYREPYAYGRFING